MDIGTAKPTRRGSSRHAWELVDVADPSEEYSVARFQREARRVVARAHARGASAVLAGGTGLYMRAALDGLDLPGRFPAVARRLEAEADGEGGLSCLYARLEALDPVAAGRIEPSNRRRLVRALEVIEGSGRRFSEWGPGLGEYPRADALLVGLRLGRAALDERLAARLAAQMDGGFLDEVVALASRPDGLSRTAREAIGYKELLAHVAGECSLEEAVAAALRRLRRLARRQEAWFYRDPRVEWFDADSPGLVAEVAKRWDEARR